MRTIQKQKTHVEGQCEVMMAASGTDQKTNKSEYEQFYKEAMDNAAQYNTRMMLERRLRLPYLDSQTGLAQSNCYIWLNKRFRSPGLKSGQLYTYPSKRWRKKRRPTPPQHVMIRKPAIEGEDVEASTQLLIKGLSEGGSMDDANLPIDTRQEVAFLNDLGPPDDFPDAGEIDNVETESDEDFVLPSKRKTKAKPKQTSRKRKAQDPDQQMIPPDEKEKPFGCKICGKRYRNRAGLNYHVTHTHQDDEEEEEAEVVPSSPLPMPSMNHPAKKVNGIAEASSYCDFCLGDAKKNVKTGEAEILVSCSDCGRSGHPSCLQFTDRMTSNVKNYRWQCIECKSCTLCGTSDNDDQLLFCDDCDRGYHMYCLSPPMSAPPEGNWSCSLCLQQEKEGSVPGVESS
ncbi:zinc finger protein ubi-d4-like isoform X1 [Anneissia japonica]|uniref:zinc finger protein ubi-d4-like isoform X1 n=1 Tax=Anneissia japonica TaxID=1529436 RepID=UPI0014256796|nr:zinc finger protein ubi-d4-like isoform X1 [Anneissia japonica]